jgi:hypothetical protein
MPKSQNSLVIGMVVLAQVGKEGRVKTFVRGVGRDHVEVAGTETSIN